MDVAPEVEWSEEEALAVAQKLNQACRNLWAAVLHRAIRDFEGATTVDREEFCEFLEVEYTGLWKLSRKERSIGLDFYKLFVRAEASEWLLESRDEPGAFGWICSTLGLDANVVRIKLTSRHDMA